MDSGNILEGLIGVLKGARDTALAYAPQVLGALIILTIGLMAAFVVKRIVIRLTVRAPRLIPGQQMRSSVQDVLDQRPIAQTLGVLAFWIVMFIFLAASTETLGLPVVTTWISGLAGYLPRVLSGLLIIAVGVISGIILKDVLITAATSARIYYASALGQVAQITIVLVSILVGLDQAGIDVSLLQGVVMIAMGAMFLGAALAFGLGAKASVSNILASHYLQNRYKVGDTIRVGEREGTIHALAPDAVILDTEGGRLSLPAHLFSRDETELLIGKSSS